MDKIECLCCEGEYSSKEMIDFIKTHGGICLWCFEEVKEEDEEND